MNIIIGVNKLSKELNISRCTVYRYMKKGMPYSRISDKKVAFDKEKVLNWLMTNK